VARTFKEIIRAKNISQIALAKQLGPISHTHLSNLLNQPRAWDKCTDLKKQVYKTLHKWSQSEEDIRSLQVSCRIERVRGTRTFSYSNSNFVNSAAAAAAQTYYSPLDTLRVAQKVNELLQRHAISIKVFATKIMGMDRGNFSKLLNRPPVWAKCTLHRQRMFTRMHEWSMLSDRQIELWKKAYYESRS
jgi:hypothetical protein